MAYGSSKDLMTDEEVALFGDYQEDDAPAAKPVDKSDLKAVVQGAVEDALRWREENLDEDQARATDFYMGRPFGNEKKGRSQIVMTVVRDAIDSVTPNLNRIFFGSDRVVEFLPFGPEDVELAAQQTDYINHVIVQVNKGFLKLNGAWKDALVRRLGVVKWWWEEKKVIQGFQHSGLTAAQVAVLKAEEGVEIQGEPEQDGTTEPSGDFPEGEATFSFYLKRTTTKGCARFDTIPSEEFVWSPNARSLEDAVMVAHTREVHGDELVAMGVPVEMVREHQGKSRARAGSGEMLQQARSVDDMSSIDRGEDEQDESTRLVRFSDVYIEFDKDGDGVAELLHVEAIGDSFEIWKDECVDEKPFALFMIDNEPHTVVTLGLADRVMDLQEIGSAVTRGMLDSLSQHLNPPTEVVEGMVNMKDLLNPEANRIVRVRQAGQMREVASSFVGKEALPVLQWFEGIEERRTGRMNGAMGINADTLQSSTQSAVAATLSAAQQRVEQYARMFAETGMSDLYKGLYRLTVRHQDQKEMVRLRGKFVEIDPRTWTAERDVIVNVGLGAAPPEQRSVFLEKTLMAQQAAFEQGLPIVGLVEIRKTLARLSEASGYRDVAEFWKNITPEEEAQWKEMKAQQPPPIDPAVVLTAEVTREEIKARFQEKLLELRVKAEEIRLKDDRERDKITRDFVAAMAKLGIEMDAIKIEQARQIMDEDLAATDLLTQIGEMIDQANAATQQPAEGAQPAPGTEQA